jgi:hypothetical protein
MYIRRGIPFVFTHHFLLLPHFFFSFLVLQWQIALLSSSLAFLLQGSCPSSLFLFRAVAAGVQQSTPEISLPLFSWPAQKESFKTLSNLICFTSSSPNPLPLSKTLSSSSSLGFSLFSWTENRKKKKQNLSSLCNSLSVSGKKKTEREREKKKKP